MCSGSPGPVPPLPFTLNVLDAELGDLAREVVLLDGLGARNRERKAPLKVLHLVHGATEQALKREGGRERKIRNEHNFSCEGYKSCVLV